MRRSRLFNSWPTIRLIIFSLIVGCFFILFYFYPFALDDFWFLRDIYHYASENGPVDQNLFSGYVGAAIQHYKYDNARLANTLYIFMLLLPKIVSATISAASFAITYLLVIKLARATTPTLFACATAFLCLCLPWQDQMFVTMYAMNYVWSAPWMLASIMVFLNKPKLNPIASFCLGLITGLCHEAFALPMFCAFITIILARRAEFSKSRKFLIAGILTGILWFLLAPSFLNRLSSSVSEPISWYQRFYVLKIDYLYFLFAVVWIYAAMRKSLRKAAFSNTCIIMLIIGGIGLLFHMFSIVARSTYPIVLVSTIGLISIGRHLFPKIPTIISKYIAPGLILVPLFIHLGYTCWYMPILNREVNTMYDAYAAHLQKECTFYLPMTENHQVSWLTLCKTNFMYNSHWSTFDCLRQALGCPSHTIIPHELKDYEGCHDFETDGNADAVVYKGHIVMPFVDGLRTTLKDGSVYVTMNGKPRVSDIVAFTGKDNKKYYLVLPLVLISDIDRTPTEVNILW